MPWTQFMDMHSGGGLKEEDYSYIYIEAPEEEAIKFFVRRFGHAPDNVTCGCCGEDYSVSESPDLRDATAYERGCDHAYFRPDGTECSDSAGWIPGKGKVEGYTSRYVERKRKESWASPHLTLEDAIAAGTFGDRGKFLLIYAKEVHGE